MSDKNLQNKNDSSNVEESNSTNENTDINQTKIYPGGFGSEEERIKKNEEFLKNQKKLKTKKVWTGVFLTFTVLNLIIAMSGSIIVNRMISSAPELNTKDFISEESSLIYDDQGEVVTEVGVYLRENITYDKCPESLVDAFLAIEDSRYFSHFGFDIPRFTAAAISNLKNRNFAQGGSTFTMQLVKNTYFTVDAGDESIERKKSIDYKIQQIYLAIKLDQQLSKKEIFQLYMNKLNFGGRIRGVQRASLYYFGKNCDELTLPESAMLAGIINLPNRYNPKAYLDYGTKRRNEVLKLMKYHGYITPLEYNLATAVKVEDLLIGDRRQPRIESKFQSYIDVVLEEAEKMTGYDPNIRGMKIYTHLNTEVQTAIEQIQNGESVVKFPDDLMQVAMVSMNVKNGGIVGIGGGRNYDGARLLNRATMNFKQPGSCIKPVLSYALAFENLGYTLDEVLTDKPITYPHEDMVLVNADGNYTGDITIKNAVGYSLNIPAILTLQKVQEKIGKQKIVNYMKSVGFSRIKDDNFHLSFAIGGTWFETTVTELVGANGMLMNEGVYNKPHTIEKIEMFDGTTIYPEEQNHRVLSPGSAWMTLQLMKNNVEGPYWWMPLLRRSYPVYAKTGTSDWGHDGVPYGIPVGQMKDKWMIAGTSDYCNAVWVGYDMAVAGKETYFTLAKGNLNIPGNINKILLDAEEKTLPEKPKGVPRPSDVTDIRYVYGTYPHVKPEEWMSESSLVTSPVSKAGLEASPLVTPEQWREIIIKEANKAKGISASIDQYGRLKVSWATPSGICSNGTRNISLHDQWGNDVECFGRCLVDLSWLLQDSTNYSAKVYVDDEEVADINSTNGFYEGTLEGYTSGEVKVCGGSNNKTSCTVAKVTESDEPPVDETKTDETTDDEHSSSSDKHDSNSDHKHDSTDSNSSDTNSGSSTKPTTPDHESSNDHTEEAD